MEKTKCKMEYVKWQMGKTMALYFNPTPSALLPNTLRQP
jgi:hypothetical protein